MKKVSVLFCQQDSIYLKLKCDVWDEKRDALNFDKKEAAIYHPPCRLFSKMKAFSKASEDEKYLGYWSIRQVKKYGGILEQPAYSSLFKNGFLPVPGCSDEFGGFTIELDQFHFGHKAQKKTWLYIVGIDKNSPLLYYVKRPGKPKFVVSTSKSSKSLPEVLRKERSATPKKFAKFLVKIVREINNLQLLK